MKISIVIPVYNNQGTLAELFAQLERKMQSSDASLDLEYVFVNDGSRDGSWSVLERLYQQNPGRCVLVDLTRNFGQINALLAGYMHASGDAVVSMSADLQDPPDIVPSLIRAWREGHKLVAAQRVFRQDGWITDKTSSLAWTLLRRFAVPSIPQGGFDFFLMDRLLCNYYIRDPEQNIFMQGRLLFYGHTPFVIPYERQKRGSGKSQTSVARRIKYFVDGFTAYSFLPLRIMSMVGIVLFLFSLLMVGIIFIYIFVFGSKVEGWASLIVVSLFLGGMQMLSLGVLGEYLWRGIEEVRRRPHFIVGQVVRKNEL